MKLTKEKRDRLLLVGIVALAVCVGVWQLLIQTTMARLNTTRGMAAAAKKKYEEAAAFLKATASLQGQAQVYSNQLAEIESAMADPVDTYSWSYKLIMNATNHAKVKLDIKEVTRPLAPGPVQLLPEFPYRAVTFELRGTAYYEEFGRFLADFENQHPYFRTQNVELKLTQDPEAEDKSARDENTERLAFRVEVVALVRPAS